MSWKVDMCFGLLELSASCREHVAGRNEKKYPVASRKHVHDWVIGFGQVQWENYSTFGSSLVL